MANEEHPINLMESMRKITGEVKTAEPVTEEKKPTFSPDLTLIRQRVKTIVDRLPKELDLSSLNHISEDTQAQVRARIREMVNLDQAPLSSAEKGILLQNVLDEVFGFGPLGPLLRDPTVAAICVNGIRPTYVERRGRWQLTTVAFDNTRHLMQNIEKILQPLGLRLDESCPMVSARLPNGSLVDAACPPISIDGPILSIRCVAPTETSLRVMVAKGTISQPMSDLLRAYVRARANIVVSAPARVAKSSLIYALSAYINPEERIITIGESAELRLKQRHWIRLETRPADKEGKNEVTMGSLVARASNMCADRIIVGDCHGSDGYELLLAVNAGAAGGMTMITANSVAGCLHRLEAMVRLGDPTIALPHARELIADGINVIVQMKRMPDGSDCVSEIVEVRGVDGDRFALTTMFKHDCVKAQDGSWTFWQHVAVDTNSKFVDQFEARASTHEQDTASRKYLGPSSQSSVDIADAVRTHFGLL